MGHTVDALVIEQRQSEACMKQGLVSIVKTQEIVITCVLCIYAQTNNPSDELCLSRRKEPA